MSKIRYTISVFRDIQISKKEETECCDLGIYLFYLKYQEIDYMKLSDCVSTFNTMKCTSTFGMAMPGRTYSNSSYKFGFNGQEKDNEINGPNNAINFDFRMFNPQIGRFLSVDLLNSSVPWQSPYCALNNNPIKIIDPTGLLGEDPIVKKNEGPSKFAEKNHISLDQLAKYNPEVFKHYEESSDKNAYWQNTGKNWMIHPNQKLNITPPKETDYMAPTNRFTYAAGALGTAAELSSSTFRVFKDNLVSPKVYRPVQGASVGWRGGSRAAITTYRFAQVGRFLGYSSFVLGVAVDGVGMYNWAKNPSSPNAVHPAKAGLNFVMGASSFIPAKSLGGGPVTAIPSLFYFGFSEFYETETGGKGWPGVAKDQAIINNLNSFNPYWQLWPKALKQ